METKTEKKTLTFTTKDFATLFGKSPRWARKLVRERRIQAVTEFGNYLIPVGEVNRILNDVVDDFDKETQVAYTAEQFGKMFGKDGAWTRRQVNDGKLKAIRGWGEMIIPTSEMHRMLESARQYIKVEA
tara:strand:+ start:1904 stop:2290 length:387 start_codon:yes stop_codon:yes gene_type:complete